MRITVKYTRVKWFVVMAFFGLTALGPQNTFAAAAKQARYLQIFDDTDFENAWNKINGASTEHCKVNKIGDIMRCLFKGPIPPTDERQIIAAFENGNFETSETISFTTYMRMMLDLRDQAENDEIDFHNQPMKATCDFNSSSLFLETLRKCGKRGWIRDKQSAPLTSNQEFGWKEPQLKQPQHYRKGSDITKFAAELIKNGVY